MKHNILVIYDQLDSELQFMFTNDPEYLELHECRINGVISDQRTQDLAYAKLFTEDGENLINWTPLSQCKLDPVNNPITDVVYIAFLP